MEKERKGRKKRGERRKDEEREKEKTIMKIISKDSFMAKRHQTI